MGVASIRVKKAGIALYSQVGDDIERAIASGKYRVGKQLPTETELQRMYGVSKFTVREALRRLEMAGLVQKKHGIGTSVLAKDREHRPRYAIEQFDDFMRMAHRARISRMSVERRKLLPHEVMALGVDDSTSYSIVSGVRRLLGVSAVMAYVKVYVPKKYEEVVPHMETGRLTSDIIERELGVSSHSIRQEISAPTLDKKLCKQIERAGITALPERAMLFRRWHLDKDGDLIICTENVFLDPQFCFNFTLVRQAPPA